MVQKARSSDRLSYRTKETTTQYMLLIYDKEEANAKVQEAGVMLSGEALRPTDAATPESDAFWWSVYRPPAERCR